MSPNIGNSGATGNMTGPKEQVDFTNFLQHANHPAIVFFTLLFKTLAVLW